MQYAIKVLEAERRKLDKRILKLREHPHNFSDLMIYRLKDRDEELVNAINVIGSALT